jgi:hypothetical protein
VTAGVRLVATREGHALVPWGEAASVEFERIPPAKLVVVQVLRRRNPQHLSKYWLVLQRVAANDPEFKTAEQVHQFVKVKLRHFDTFIDEATGRVLIRTKSIGVASMDQIEFNGFYDRAMYVLSQRLGIDVEALLNG